MNFFQYFFLDKVDHQELMDVLLTYFKSASTFDGGNRCRLSGTAHFLEVYVDKKGTINKVVSSKRFPIKNLEEIRSLIFNTLISNQKRAVGQIIGFCDEKVEGTFRYKDLFQIVPVPKIAPQPQVSVADHPFRLQFSYNSSSHSMTDSKRRTEKATVYVRLLNLLSKRRITFDSGFVEFNWVMETKNPKKWTAEWRQGGYTYKGLSGRTKRYSYLKRFRPIALVPSKKYYSERQVRGTGALQFPNNLSKSIDLAFSLDKKDWGQFYMACSWYSQAEDIWQRSNSSSFIAMVSAIECLIDKPEQCPECDQTITVALGKCSSCKKPIYRLTQNFKNFLRKYVSFIDQFPNEKKVLYDVRSKLSHGLDLFSRDLQPWNFMIDVKTQEEAALQRNLHFIVSTAIYKWLWARAVQQRP